MKLKRRQFLRMTGAGMGLAGVGAILHACGGPRVVSPDALARERNAYLQTNLVSDTAARDRFSPEVGRIDHETDFINAWGIAIRPAGVGGHFWVSAGGYAFEFVGDVRQASAANLRTLFQDPLTTVSIPGAGPAPDATHRTDTGKFEGFATGTVFNGAPLDSDRFVVADQPVNVDGVEKRLTGSARFIFATDSGIISGWTERDPANFGTPVRRNGPAIAMIDGSGYGAAFFGLTIRPGTWDMLWVADFGETPQIRAYGRNWERVPVRGFANPFASGDDGAAMPGDYVPFNVQVLNVGGTDRLFVAYAKSQADPNDPSRFLAGEEDAVAKALETETPDRGKVAMFDLDGNLIRVFADEGRLNAPWGLAMAPANFGALSNALLVGNFGGRGRIAAFDPDTGTYIDWLRGRDGASLAIDGLWGLQFGNGASLGDSNALYFTAGPEDETHGLFGSLRYAASQ
jgi:uncharacterized protein (TIGR03118 family)